MHTRVRCFWPLLVGLCLLMSAPLRAQDYFSRWDFGNGAGLYFGPDSTRAVGDSQMQSSEACATICDRQGQLLFYGNGAQLWNRQHVPMSNGLDLGGHAGAAQGCLIVAHPSLAGHYYVFTLDAFEHQLSNGLRLAEVDMSADAGRGAVIRKQVPVLPDTLLTRLGTRQLVEEMTAIRHANGRDYWLVTHLYYSDAFVSVLISPGVVPGSRCVVSRVGRQVGYRTTSFPYLAGGSLAASPNGRRLAYTQAVQGTELYDFDPATGRLSNALPLVSTVSRSNLGAYYCGAAFSPNGQLLYTSLVFPDGNASVANPNIFVQQYDMQPTGGLSIAQSGQVVYRAPQLLNGKSRFVRQLQRGPDGLIYAAILNGNRLDVIRQPNQRGAQCQYTVDARWLSGAQSQMGLPNVPNDAFRPTLTLSAAACGGLTPTLTAGGTALGVLGDTLIWQFGDGQVRQTTTSTLTHTYQPGRYTVTVQLWRRGQPQATATLPLTVEAPLQAPWPADTVWCPSVGLLLPAGPQPAGTTYQWSDGSTGTALSVSGPGIYWLELRSGAGCTTRSTINVRDGVCPVIIPNVITPNGDRQNDFFVLKGLPVGEWSCRIFNRWGRLVFEAAAYQNDWGAAGQPAGVYYYQITNRLTQQVMKGHVEVIR